MPNLVGPLLNIPKQIDGLQSQPQIRSHLQLSNEILHPQR
jgi:hypothetical protein